MSDGPTHPVLTLAIEIANPGSAPGAGGRGGGGGVAIGLVTPGDGGATTLIGSEPLREVERDRDDLIPAIERLLAGSSHTLKDLKQIAVSVGPGGFTSTRVACATGAMLAEGLGVPAVAVPSALVAVVHARRVAVGSAGPVAVLMASKGPAVWCVALPDTNPQTWAAAARSGRMMAAAEVVATGAKRALADHHLPADTRAALAAAGVSVEPLVFTAEDCLAASALCTPGDASVLVPLYPREPEAVTLWRARHGSAKG